MKNRLTGMFVAACAVAVYVVPLVAQEPRPIVRIVRFHVKPDRVGEFRDIQARFTAARKAQGTFPSRGVWRNVNNGSEYGIVTTLENYASNAGPPTMPETEFQRLVARLQQCYDDRDIVISTSVADLSILPATPPNMVLTNTVTIRPGTRAKYLELRKQLVEEYKKLGVPGFGVRRVRLGGPGNTYRSWTAVDKMSDLDGPSWAAKAFEAMGEAAASKWLEENRKIVLSNERDIYAYEPDLSYYTAP